MITTQKDVQGTVLGLLSSIVSSCFLTPSIAEKTCKSPEKSTMPFRRGILLFCILFFSTFYMSAEEVGKFAWTGSIAGFDNTTLNPPLKTVAMSEYIHVSSNIFDQTEPDPCSIVFIIDNSGSNGNTDQDGQRFDAVRELVEYIYTKAPETKVGLVLFGSRLWFYKPDNSNLFVSIAADQFHGGNGCVIPPLGLNETYSGQASGFPGGTISYNKTGLEVIQMYLETKTDPWGGIVAKYTPTHTTEYWETSHNARLTNITRAFDGANQAHLYPPPFNKNRHFNIFFSDGIAALDVARNPDYPYLEDYIDGINTPTTFTVYYGGDQSAIAKLQQMTNNIKSNGYSENNPIYSDCISLNDWATIQTKLIELFNKILTSTSTTPISITVNTSTSNDWDSTGFLHKRMFPLQKGTTSFNMELDVHIKRDSLDDNGNVISTIEKDTTFILDYDVEVGPATTVPDSMTLTWWGRNMDLYYNGNVVTIANEEMTDLQVRFTEYKVDTTYGYEINEMELIVSSSINGDEEELTFETNTGFFDCNFTTAGNNATPVKNDGILQLAAQDTIVLLFKNTYLPLDTLEKVIPYSEGSVYTLHTGIYFDNDANGHVDSLYLGISGTKLDENVDAIMDNIELPAHRDFTVDSYAAVSGGITLNVTEKASAILTYVTADDFIETDSVVLSVDAVIMPAKINIIDSMAPVIMTASLVDSVLVGARDELTVTFSEDVESITAAQPFKYYSINNQQVYDATLNTLSQNGTIGVFEVVSLNGVTRIQHGDSIRVNWIFASNVYDALGNNQDNPENIRREINVKLVEKGMKIEQGVYFDNNADGYVDSIFISISGKKVAEHVDDLMKEILLPPYRIFTVNTYSYSTGGIAVDVTEKNTTITTYVTDKDTIVVLKEVLFSDGESVIPSKITAIDSIAPIIMSAHLRDSLKSGARDELDVVFSENVGSITRDQPFKFLRVNPASNFDATLSVISQNANFGRFEVLTLTGVTSIEPGDSIWIHWIYDDNVSDELGNNQDNLENRHRVITVEKIPDDIDLIVKALIYDPDLPPLYVPDNFYTIPQLMKVLDETGSITSGHQGIMIITVEPDPIEKYTEYDSLSGKISLFDPLGNTVIYNDEMGYDSKGKRLVYIWRGDNEQGRQVGPGGYAAIIPCIRYCAGYKRQTWNKRATVGVKE